MIRRESARRTFLGLLVLLVLLQEPTANGASVERERILEGAKKEGQLVLYAGMDTDEAHLRGLWQHYKELMTRP